MFGSCCNEVDLWEGNSFASAFSAHSCSAVSQTRCEGSQCGTGDSRYQGTCDRDGCDFNSYRLGDKSFFGAGKTIDTTKNITVVTQFITGDGTLSGKLVEIRRKYVQDGKVIENSQSASIPTLEGEASISDSFCAKQKNAFGDTNYFATKGGLTAIGDSMERRHGVSPWYLR